MIPKTVKKRATFVDVSRNGFPVRTRGVVSICKATNDEVPLVGYTASRKVGNSVLRNYARRRLRALVREFSTEFVPGCVYVFIATKRTVELKFSDLRSDFAYSLRKAKENRLRDDRKVVNSTSKIL